MVSEITAYKADDGSIHSTRLAALKHDAFAKLSKMDVFNAASAQAVVSKADEIVAILAPIVEAQDAR